MQEQGLKQKDLAPILGGKNRVSEVLNGKRPLTLSMIRALNETLKIPVESLISHRDYRITGTDINSNSYSETFDDEMDVTREPVPSSKRTPDGK
ncbi:MAG: helix-turn-helix domain-containing protein [Gammaproteobacteria bacterium]